VTANSGFRISGVTNSATLPFAGYVSGHGDFNGDGLSDLAFTPYSQSDEGRYVIWGKTSAATVNITNNTTIAASDGFRVSSAQPLWQATPLSVLGDVNGDGLDDLGVTVRPSGTLTNYAVLYGSSTGSLATIPVLTSGGSFVGGHQIQSYGGNGFGGQNGPGGLGGDINGDGYADVVTRSENWNSTGGTVSVYFGGRTLPAA
jgi:hypothetical protein